MIFSSVPGSPAPLAETITSPLACARDILAKDYGLFDTDKVPRNWQIRSQELSARKSTDLSLLVAQPVIRSLGKCSQAQQWLLPLARAYPNISLAGAFANIA